MIENAVWVSGRIVLNSTYVLPVYMVTVTVVFFKRLHSGTGFQKFVFSVPQKAVHVREKPNHNKGLPFFAKITAV